MSYALGLYVTVVACAFAPMLMWDELEARDAIVLCICWPIFLARFLVRGFMRVWRRT